MLGVVASFIVLTVDAYVNEEIIRKVNSDTTSTWKAGPSPRFANWTLEQIKQLMGYKPPPAGVARNSTAKKVDMTLPEEFDARVQWPNCRSIKMIRDQGNCGSCWAFGAAESFSDRYCITSRAQQQPVFSPYALMTCSYLNNGCDGGMLSTAWMFIEMNGLPLDSCQPYVGVDGQTPPCEWGRCLGSGSWSVNYVSDSYDPGCGLFSCDPAAMQQDLYVNGPFEGSFTVYEDFMNYQSGVYRHVSGQELGGHAIKIIGWGVENGTPYWLVSNSWGVDWGMNGFFKILRGVNECGIESDNGAGFAVVSN